MLKSKLNLRENSWPESQSFYHFSSITANIEQKKEQIPVLKISQRREDSDYKISKNF